MNRFEGKIAFALALTAILPLVVALAFAARLVDESVAVGLNPQVEEAVKARVPMTRDFIRARLDYFKATLAAVAVSQPLEDALAAGDAQAATAALSRVLSSCDHCTSLIAEAPGKAGGPKLVARAKSARAFPLQEWSERSFPSADEGGRKMSRIPGATVRLTAVLEKRHQDALEVAGEFQRLYDLVATKKGALRDAYIVAFGVILGSALIIALLLGVYLARRVTGRISVLIDATRRVAGGDLTFAIPVRAGDEIADLTQSFNKMLADLSEGQRRIVYLETIAAWQEIARRLAHEIKNPLTPILLAMQQVHKKYPGGDATYQRTVDQALEVVTEEVESLRALVTEFSDFAKLPSVNLQLGDLAAFAREIERAESTEGQAIEAHIEDGEIRVAFDRMLLRRAVTNLLKNAREAMRDASTASAPALSLRVVDRQAQLDVLDRGPGVSAEIRARIFDPYYTTKHDGTGLGLSIVKKIVLDHGGTITVLDHEGGGADFRITLPLAPPGHGRASGAQSGRKEKKLESGASQSKEDGGLP